MREDVQWLRVVAVAFRLEGMKTILYGHLFLYMTYVSMEHYHTHIHIHIHPEVHLRTVVLSNSFGLSVCQCQIT